MDRDLALRFDARLDGVMTSLTALAQYLRKHAPESPDRSHFILCIGRSMGQLIEISDRLYEIHPDIKPSELQPPHLPE